MKTEDRRTTARHPAAPAGRRAGGIGAVAVAARGKGVRNLARRARAIGDRYGPSPQRMERSLASLRGILQRYASAATLPVTAAATKRHPEVIRRYAALGVEFAVHGQYHVDHRSLSDQEQLDQIGRARVILQDAGIRAVGFRAPYLRWNSATLRALRAHGFLYDSSQSMHWQIDTAIETDAYRRVLDFYGSIPAAERPVLPWTDDGVIRIPCCLPDDEAVVDRLRVGSGAAIRDLWLDIFRATHERGELFTMQVHPERIGLCAVGVAGVLEAARAARPTVWIARLDEIATWWRDRSTSTVHVREDGPERFHVRVTAPEGATVLARGLDTPGAQPWGDGYVHIQATAFDVTAPCRPVIGIHPSSPAGLGTFLREQGYIVEIAERDEGFGLYLHRDRFEPANQRSLIDEVETGRSPLLRLGRWPDGAQSALSITGDVDALTVWDYALRFLGR